MAQIDITVTTVNDTIIDADGNPAWGWIRVRPNIASEYTNGGVFQVTPATTEIKVVDGKIVGAPILQPNFGAGNVPETFYIARYDVNGQRWTEFWRLDGSGLASYSIEIGAIERIPTGTVNAEIEALKAQNDPFRQYLLRSDLTLLATLALAADGLGRVPRLNKSTGKLDKSVYSGGPGGVEAADIPISVPGIVATDVNAALGEIDAEVTAATAAIAAEILARIAADALKVNRAGDTMTGQLSGIAPVSAANLTRKDYVDTGLGTKVNTADVTSTPTALKVARFDAAGNLHTEDGNTGDEAVAAQQFLGRSFSIDGTQNVILGAQYENLPAAATNVAFGTPVDILLPVGAGYRFYFEILGGLGLMTANNVRVELVSLVGGIHTNRPSHVRFTRTQVGSYNVPANTLAIFALGY